MNILFTTHQGELAGSTLSLFYLAKGLADKGHNVHVVCKRDVLLWKKLETESSVTLHDFWLSSYLDLNFCFQLRKIVKQNDISILNAQGGKDRNLVMLAKWIFGLNCQIVFTRRQRPRDEPWIKRWFHTKGTSRIVMISHGLKDIFVSRGYDPKHLRVIHNGIPEDLADQLSSKRVEAFRKKLDIIDKRIIGCVSRKKSQEQLIEAFKFLPQDYACLFVGISKAEVDPQLINSISQPVRFTGLVSHDEALHYLKLMDVNVLPSYLDGFGLVLVESMLLQVPVIGSNFGGIPDVIQDRNNGLLFENGDPKELAGKILQITQDDSLKTKLIDQGLSDAKQKFSVRRMVNEYETFFKSLYAN